MAEALSAPEIADAALAAIDSRASLPFRFTLLSGAAVMAPWSTADGERLPLHFAPTWRSSALAWPAGPSFRESLKARDGSAG